VKFTVKKERDTKNTVRYQEVPEKGAETVMDTAYFKKSALQADGLADAEELVVEVMRKA
jgi:hypothetical protein